MRGQEDKRVTECCLVLYMTIPGNYFQFSTMYNTRIKIHSSCEIEDFVIYASCLNVLS